MQQGGHGDYCDSDDKIVIVVVIIIIIIISSVPLLSPLPSYSLANALSHTNYHVYNTTQSIAHSYSIASL